MLTILIIGSGGREHALAWKLAQSPRVGRIFVAPGNGSTALGELLAVNRERRNTEHGQRLTENVPIAATDIPALVAFAGEMGVGLTVVGPEAPLAAGIVDAFQAAGLPIFGPTRAAAQLEASKAFAKQFMRQHGIPTGDFAVFADYDTAVSHLQTLSGGVVIKASGLAAGKGVIVCDDRAEAEAALRQMMLDKAFGSAGTEVLVEERLTGPELSVLAFCDGRTVVPMLPARDHKRVYDGDRGPNTGGMGVFAPPPDVDGALIDEVVCTILQPTVDGMAARGTPYVGVLYAGLMLTAGGPKVLEFNCRFGDPETQVILPMMDGDLADILLACVEGRLRPEMARWHPGACAAVVMAAPGYPGVYPKGLPISGLDSVPDDVMVFHAGTAAAGDVVVTAGGRVLAVAARGDDLETAVSRAYAGVAKIHFEGAHYRTDIGASSRQVAGGKSASGKWQVASGRPATSYAQAGVDIAAGLKATVLMKTAVQSTYTPDVLSNMGSFGGLFRVASLKQINDPILVASTDGVGTKTKVAARLNRWGTIGYDIVNHCVNDILVQGARPLFFLDYVASARLDPAQAAAIVSGAAAACRAVGCVLLGGETAEMPGVYEKGAVDLVGTIVGVVDRAALIDGSRIQAGDVLIGLPSSGLHTNGYTLARAALAGLDWRVPRADLNGRTIGEALLEPHRCYLHDVAALWQAGVDVRGLAHITGGGLVDNPPRIFPDGLGAVLRRGAWLELPIFGLIQRQGQIADAEMYHVFNMGLGMLVVVPPEQVALVQQVLPETAVVGEMAAGVVGVEIVTANSH
ncbi:MAG: hypothetical protein Kow0080_00560 [Candidatus Promineifilaceae bacterium]